MKMCNSALCIQALVFIYVFKTATCYVNLADTECGMDWTRNARIVGGEDSQPSEFPWAASIWRQGAHQCGATVLNNQWLLTAGHCICSAFHKFYEPIQLSVVVGYTDISSVDGAQTLSKLIPHPNYRCQMKANDVALLMTTRQLKWSNDIKPVCLPKPFSSDFSGAIATVAGWGFTNEDRGKGSRPNILQKTKVMVVRNEECSRWYESSGVKVKVTDTQVCAGHESGGRDSCWADSGGPLMVHETSGRVVIVGVVSTGNGCARPKMPGIYTRVSQYVDWITSTMQENGHPKLRRSWYRNA